MPRLVGGVKFDQARWEERVCLHISLPGTRHSTIGASGEAEMCRFSFCDAAKDLMMMISDNNSAISTHLPIALCSLTGDVHRSEELYARNSERAGSTTWPGIITLSSIDKQYNMRDAAAEKSYRMIWDVMKAARIYLHSDIGPDLVNPQRHQPHERG
nr:hypothetical protein CFP56_31757 [Quercus suber]